MAQSEHVRLHATGSKDEAEPSICQNCGGTTPLSASQCCSLRCSSALKEKKTGWPSPEDVQRLLFEKPTRDLAKDLGVSDAAVAKFSKRHGLTKPGRGYWGTKENRIKR
jgi:ribosomal protein L40E